MKQLELPWRKPTALLSVQELYEEADIKLLQSIHEDYRFERKPSTVQADFLGDYFSMFANTKPDGGLIAVGMEDDGKISGCENLQPKRINKIETTGDTYCPDAKYEVKRLPARRYDGKHDFVILFRVFYRSEKVVKTVRGEAFVRRGESKKKLTSQEVRELQNEKGEIDLELESCNSIKYPDGFATNLIDQFTNEFRRSRGLQTDLSNEEILVLRNLGRLEGNNFVPNIACVLLFAKNPTLITPGCKIRFFRFEGEREGSGEEFNPVKDIWIEGNIPILITKTEEVLKSQLRDFSRLGSDGKFYTAPEYPPLAWYEAIVNACVHRSYGLRNMNIFVKMFDDRLVVESPGGFPGLVTPENIYDMHHPRNPRLMDAMFYLNFVRCAHEGTRRIRDSMIKLNLPAPEFSQKEVSHVLVRVTLRNNIKQRKIWIDSDASEIVGKTLANLLSDHERRIINFLAENRTINVSQVQRLTRRSWPFSKRLLVKLEKMGVVKHCRREHLERDPKAFYVLKNVDNEY